MNMNDSPLHHKSKYCLVEERICICGALVIEDIRPIIFGFKLCSAESAAYLDSNLKAKNYWAPTYLIFCMKRTCISLLRLHSLFERPF